MDGLSILDPSAWEPASLKNSSSYAHGNALGWLSRTDKQASVNQLLGGRLYLAKSGWLLLSVPNAFVRGLYDALVAPGAELPLAGTMNVPNVDAGVLNAHISVMTADEVKQVGADKINERGHMFHYGLGPVKEIPVTNIDGVSKVWIVQVASPQLAALRKSYGLSPLPKGDQPFHITIAARRKHVLGNNPVSKFDNAPSRGELKAASHEGAPWGTPADKLPWRERVEVYAHDPKGRIYGGIWDTDKSFAVPGGGIDPGEDPSQAAIRELEEETGIKATNPRVLPIAPVDNAWSDKHRQEKKRNFAGSRTHFVAVDILKKLRRKNLDHWGANQRKMYDPAEAAAMMSAHTNFMAPDVAAGRLAALKHLIAAAAEKKSAAAELSRPVKKDLLRGGEADNLPDREFSESALSEGIKHEHEHTDNDEIAKEIAKDHLQEDPAYYKKVEQIEKASSPVLKLLREAKEHSDNKRYGQKTQILRRLMAQSPQDWMVDDDKPKYKGITHKPTKFRFHTDPTAIDSRVKAAYYNPNSPYGSVYLQEMLNQFNRRVPITYDHNLPLFKNIQNQLLEIKQRGDFILRTRQNAEAYRAHLDPVYRQQRAMDALYNRNQYPSTLDRVINRYGDGILASGGA